jgi:hypothetical protein
MAELERQDGHIPDQALGSRNGQITQLIEAAYGAPPERRGESAPVVWGHPAVARVSGHLATMQRTVYPAARRRLGDDVNLLRECRAHARETGWALRLLHCHLAGDEAAGGRQPEHVHGWLEQCLDGYRLSERALVAWMEERLTAAEREQLAIGYRAAIVHAPTRPHPRGPHTGWPGRAAFRLHAVWDAFLDGIDSRPTKARLK